MKYIIAFILGLLSLVGIYFFVQYNSQPLSFSKAATPSSIPIPSRTIVQGKSQKLLFVPYWGISNKTLPTDYDQLIYFGVEANENGINTLEDGYKEMPQFIKQAKLEKKLLTIRMIDQTFNAKVLKEKSIQNKIIADAVHVAQTNGFDGVIVDFEYNALAFDSVIQAISSFSTNFAKSAHAAHLTYYQALYGDTFARLRPYDVSNIAKNADGVMVMAYDLHKANGDPGPNFPLYEKDSQGYDLKTMVDDFAKKMPTTKLFVAFGMYGYDWEVDKNGHSSSQAVALSDVQIQQKFLSNCTYVNCVVKRDPNSSETKITYIDAQKNNHIVWFEDKESMLKKSAYLHTQGINATAFWAYSYF